MRSSIDCKNNIRYLFDAFKLTDMKTQRRTLLKNLFASLVGVTGVGLAVAKEAHASESKVAGNIAAVDDVPLYSGFTKFGNLVFISGKGAHVAPFTIAAHTEIVLKELEKELINAGSSMDKVLKVNVYLNDIADYKGMNDIYKGRFGKNPPVRTTVAVAKGGVPNDSLVEMDCIAHI
jgi:enamine deaminase RidA (YjgF/YER057c/UK114 family)